MKRASAFQEIRLLTFHNHETPGRLLVQAPRRRMRRMYLDYQWGLTSAKLKLADAFQNSRVDRLYLLRTCFLSGGAGSPPYYRL